MADPNWAYWLAEAYTLALKSPDPSTQIGALLLIRPGLNQLVGDLVGVCGSVNCFPNGIKVGPERLERPLKYRVIEHAERNTIFKAARNGISTDGATLVCSCDVPCNECTRAIIQAGISRVVFHKRDDLSATHADPTKINWAADHEVSLAMMAESGIEIIRYDGPVNAEPVLRAGKLWSPASVQN